MKIKKFFSLLVLTSFSLSVLAGPPEPAHPITPAEKAFFENTLKKIKASLPAIPAGWKFVEEDEPMVPEEVVDSATNGRLDLDYTWKIEVKDKEAREAKLVQKISEGMGKIKMGPDGLPVGAAALMAKNQKLAEEMTAAFNAKDMKKVEKIQQKMANVGAEMEKLQNANQAVSEVPVNEKRAIIGDSTASIWFDVNPEPFGIYTDAKVLTPPPGVAFAYRNERLEKYEAEVEGETILFIGDWKKNEKENTLSIAPSKKKYSDVHGMVIIIRAETKRAEELMKGMKLKGLL